MTPAPDRRSLPKSRRQRLHELARAIGRHRRWVSAGCVGLAAAIAVSALAPAPPPGEFVLTTARNLAPGAVLGASDLRLVRFARAQLPDGVLTSPAAAIGHRLAGAMRRGEPLTDVRLDDGFVLADPGAGLVATTVRLADLRAAELLEPGTRIDVLAAAGATLDSTSTVLEPAAVVAHDVTVIELPAVTAAGATDTDPLGQDGALVVLATTPEQARLLAQAQVSDRLSAVSIG
jgi:pilus assembly protein CpaB